MMNNNGFHGDFKPTRAMSEPRAQWISPLFDRRHVVVRDLPVAMGEPGRGTGYLPVIQLIKDWNNEPGCRSAMIDKGPPAGTETITAAKIAAAVHALCTRDKHPVPQWVMEARAPYETTLVPDIDLNSGFGQKMRATATAVCHYHRVYFSVENLDST